MTKQVSFWGFGLIAALLLMGAGLWMAGVGPDIAAFVRGGTAPDAETYAVRGRFIEAQNEGTKLIVEHEAIPGFMMAMTMSFTPKAPGAVPNLERGDALAFQYHVGTDSAWITDVERLPDDEVAPIPSADRMTRATAPPDLDRLEEGDAVPDLSLVNQDNEPIDLGAYDGQALLVTFIFTRCPDPTFCPRMSRRFQTLQEELMPAYANDVQLLSITIDPEHDRPDVLRDYAARYTDDLATWTFATGTPETIARAGRLFGVFYEYDSGQINHTLATALIAPDGRLDTVWRGNRWQPDAVLNALDALPSTRS